MSTKICLAISYPYLEDPDAFPEIVVLLDLIYRSWTFDDDFWTTRTPGVIGANSGTWYHQNGGVLLSAVNPSTGKRESILNLRGAQKVWHQQPFKVEKKRHIGWHWFSGSQIPRADSEVLIGWKVVWIQ